MRWILSLGAAGIVLLVAASSVYLARSIEADEPTPPATDEPAPTRGPRIASGPHGDGSEIQIPRVEGRVATGVVHHEYGDIICEYDANVEVSMDGRVAKITQQSNSARLPVQVGERVADFHETMKLYLDSELTNPYGAQELLDIPAYQERRDRGTLPGAVYRDENGTLHWGCETWLLSGEEMPSRKEQMERLREEIGDIESFKSHFYGD